MAKLKVKSPKPKAKPKAVAADHAVATSKKPTTTDAEKIETCNDLTTTMKASPNWAKATDVQNAANGWLATNALLAANVTLIGSLREQLFEAVGASRGLRVAWTAGRKHTLAAVNVFCAGSASMIEQFGCDELVKSAVGGEIVVPTDIVTSPGVNLGEMDLAWDEGLDRHGFMVQYASDPTNATTYVGPIPCTVPSFTLTGQTSGATMHARVAAIDPTQPGHMTAWSLWVAGTVH
jgi:hypothetical protein